MDKVITPKHTNILFCAIGATVLALIAYIDFLQYQYVSSLITAAMAAMLLINGLCLLAGQYSQKPSYLDWISIVLLAVFAYIASEHQHGQHIYWIYFYPIAAFFLFQLHVALLLLLLYIPLVLYIIFNFAPVLEQPEIVFSFAGVCVVVYFLAMVKARTNKLLEPLIGTDLETGAQLEKFLRPALNTEITRAEREGTGLLLMYLQLDDALQIARKDNREQLVHECAQAISKQLRIFDHYYRLSDDSFAVVLPHATTEEAQATCQNMIAAMPTALHSNIQVGLTSLNVGDTADSLIELVKQELKHV